MLKSNILILLLLASCFIVACKTDPAYDKAAQLLIDDDIIRNRLAETGATAAYTKTPEGLYYRIVRPGEGETPVANDMVGIHFVGRLFLNQQSVFDSTFSNLDTTKFILSSAIEGWQRGIPLIKPGGRISLIVPSTMAYQDRQIDTVLRANSILDFDIQFHKILPPVIVTTN